MARVEAVTCCLTLLDKIVTWTKMVTHARSRRMEEGTLRVSLRA